VLPYKKKKKNKKKEEQEEEEDKLTSYCASLQEYAE
jgi:hypothetical protein